MVSAPAPKHANMHNTPMTIPTMVPGDALSAFVTGDNVLLADVFDSVAFLVGETVGTDVVIEVFVLVVRLVVVGVAVDESELVSGETDENAVDVIPREAVVVLETGVVVGLLDPTVVVPAVGSCDDVNLRGGKLQVHSKLKVWPAPMRSILNCISFTPQSVLSVPSQ